MLLRESLGISADGTEKAFPLREVEAMLTRRGPAITFNRRDPTSNTTHLVIACDPSGGGASAFSICSIVQDRCAHSNPTTFGTYPLTRGCSLHGYRFGFIHVRRPLPA